MLNIITFKGSKNREKFVAFSEALRVKKVFHRGKLFDNMSVISYTNNIRGYEFLEKED